MRRAQEKEKERERERERERWKREGTYLVIAALSFRAWHQPLGTAIPPLMTVATERLTNHLTKWMVHKERQECETMLASYCIGLRPRPRRLSRTENKIDCQRNARSRSVRQFYLIPLPKITLADETAACARLRRLLQYATTSAVVLTAPLATCASSSSSTAEPASRPSADCYLPISYRPLESLLNWEGWGGRESGETMEETEEQTFTFAILSLSCAATCNCDAREWVALGVSIYDVHTIFRWF